MTSTQANASRSRSVNDVLRAQVSDVRVLASLIRPIAFSTIGNFNVSDPGISVTTEADRSVQAVAYVSASIFDEFEFQPPPPLSTADTADRRSAALDSPMPCLDFDIDLVKLLECLNVFGGAPPSNSFTNRFRDVRDRERGPSGSRPASRWGGDDEEGGRFGSSTQGQAGNMAHPLRGDDSVKATSMKMRWRGPGHGLILLLEEQDVTTRCELATFEPAGSVGLTYNHHDTQAQAIMQSDFLLDALSSIDTASCSKVALLFSNAYLPSRNRRNPMMLGGGGKGRDVSQSVVSDQFATQQSNGTGRPMLKVMSDGDFGTAEVSRRTEGGPRKGLSTQRTQALEYTLRD